MKISLAIVFATLLLTGCAAEKQPAFPTTNPLEKACQAEGVGAGDAMQDCMRRKGAEGLARSACGSKGQTCVTMKTQFNLASSECMAQGMGTESPERLAAFKACIAGKAPQAAAYEFGTAR